MDGIVMSRWSLDSIYPSHNFSDCPNGSLWIWNVFYECAQDSRDIASVVLGVFSLVCFVGASFPQFWRSCKTGNMDQALSIWFLLAWLAGDSCNFVGAFLAQQLPLQTFTAVYYVCADILMISLYCYYKLRNQRHRPLSTPINALCGVALLGTGTAFLALGGLNHESLETSDSYKGRSLLSADSSGCKPFSTNEKIGFAIGAVSSVLYLLSRVPQIATNFRRKSTEGVAVSLFLMAILGNLTYGLSVLLKNPEKDQAEGNYLVHHLPWLIGSLGVVSLDLFILFQFFLYRRGVSITSDPEEAKPLLSSQNGPIYA